MNQARVDQIASAVLYEGYILYPYRPSVKNRQRWTFGGLVPRAYSEANSQSDPWTMQTECLVIGGNDTKIFVSVRFLQLVARLIGKYSSPQKEWPADGSISCPIVECLQAGDEVYYTWQEAVEQMIDLDESKLEALAEEPNRRNFVIESQRDRQPLNDAAGLFVGDLVRERRRIEGAIELSTREVSAGVFRITVKIENQTHVDCGISACRDEALMHGLVSTHSILSARDGEFVSMIDPPEEHRALVAACTNVGCWPVLVGEEGEKDTILSAPIILYDYPQIAPESPGELFDGTEIDEILTLRIMTLTDDEKAAMAAVDERAGPSWPAPSRLAKSSCSACTGHSAGFSPRGEIAIMDSWDPSSEPTRLQTIRVVGVDYTVGDRVRLWPLDNADIFDMALKGKTATIAAIEQDFEDRVYLAVTVDDDPGRDLGAQGKPGHRFFYRPEEVEPLDASESRS